MIRFDSRGLVSHELPAPAGLIRADRIFDVGAGLRPMNWYRPAQHICIEPHRPYAERLEAAGFEVRHGEAAQILGSETADAVYMLDVIEHMTREDGLSCLEAAKRYARQIVVFTPNGFLEQHGDAWGMGGEHWQEHRSGWVPSDFPGWSVTMRGKGFYAVWTR